VHQPKTNFKTAEKEVKKMFLALNHTDALWPLKQPKNVLISWAAALFPHTPST